MDKGRRDVRHRTNRFSKKKSGIISGFPGKSKKGGNFEKVGLAGEVKSTLEDLHKREMVCEIEASMKKSKLPKRNFKDTNGVVHASVPRKLRSAMKKRKLESVSRSSMALKKLNVFKTRIESPKECIKKEKQEMEWKVITEPISKDEEEVVETLFALAGMFPGTDSTDKTGRSDDVVPDEDENQLESIKVAEVDSTSVAAAEPTTGESCEPPVSILSSATTKKIYEMPITRAENFNLDSPGTLDFLGGLKHSAVNITARPKRVIEVAIAMKDVETKLARSDVDDKSVGLALWPGLLSTGNPGAHVLPKPSAVKVPPWLGGGAPSPPKTASLRSVQQKKLKRCASHIYISRLISVLQTSASPLNLQQNESGPTDASIRDPRSTTNYLEKITSTGDALNSQRYPNPHPLDTKPFQDMVMTQPGFKLDGPQPSGKHSFDFLSLSSGTECKIIANDSRNGSASAPSSVLQSHFPLPDSFPQHHLHPWKTFSMPQPETFPIPSAYHNRLPAASISHQGRPQLSPYPPGPFAAAAYHNQQQQQEQFFWASQYRPGGAGNTILSNQFAGKPIHISRPSNQTDTIASIQAMSARYNDLCQQQQRLMAMSMNHQPSQAMMMNRQENPIGSIQ